MRKIIPICCLVMLILTGCGASFEASPSKLEAYANDNSGEFVNATPEYSKYEYVDGVYLAEMDGVHIELWDLDNVKNTSMWFQNNVETLKKDSSSHAGASTSKSGDYKINTSDNYYRILFNSDKGIYAYGEKEKVDAVLEAIFEIQ